ncbi:MAG: triple tyrosine motif-containing protein, partial [Bacteroidota bacterium]
MRACFYIAILITALVQIQAQTLIVPEKLTIEDGLSQGYISTIHQDSEGFLWLGTKNGLNRYDGKQFELFTYDPLDDYALSSDWVLDIHEKGDFLLLANDSKYLNLLHKKAKRFYRLPLQAERMETSKEAVEIVEDTLGHFWVQLQQPNQVIRLTFPDDFWTDFSKDTSLLSDVDILFIAESERLFEKNNEIFIVQAGVTNQVDIHTLAITSVVPKELATRVVDFHKISPRLAWAKTKYAVKEQNYQLFNLQNDKWQALHTDFQFTKYYFQDESSNLLWVQRYKDNEIFLFEIEQLEKVTTLRLSDANYRIPNIDAGLTAWYKDQSGIMWMGTGGLGLRKVSPRRLAIKTYKSGVSVYNHIFSSSLDEVFFHRFGTEDFYKARSTANLQNIFQFIKSTKIKHLYWLNEHAGTGWLLTREGQASGEQHEIKLYYYQNGTLEELAQWIVADAQIDSELSLMKGQQDHFFILFANTFIQYDLRSKQSQIFTIDLFSEIKPAVFYAAQTANGDVWIGTTQGLIQAKRTQQGFDFQWVEGLRNPVCASVLTDPKDGNILWIGTKGGGLHRLDSRNMQLEYLHTKNGLPNDVIYSVLNDEEGNIWMSSNKGIIRYSPATGVIRNFTADDGMQSNEFNTYAFGKSPNGELLFGGISGLNVFHPNDLKDNPIAPKVNITGLEINNQAISVLDSTNILEEAIEFTSAITLPYQKNSVSLTFAALEFSAPKKNQFSYYLEGAEAEWTHTTTDNRAAYLNLSPGNYTFKLKAANGDQVWSEDIKTLDIMILPPWYRTILAYLIYALLLGLFVWLYIRFQRNRLQLKHSLEL